MVDIVVNSGIYKQGAVNASDTSDVNNELREKVRKNWKYCEKH